MIIFYTVNPQARAVDAKSNGGVSLPGDEMSDEIDISGTVIQLIFSAKKCIKVVHQ